MAARFLTQSEMAVGSAASYWSSKASNELYRRGAGCDNRVEEFWRHHGPARQITGRAASTLRGSRRTRLSRRPDLSRALCREEFRTGLYLEPARRVSAKARAAGDDSSAPGKTALSLAG